MSEFALEITTAISPPKKFKLDDEAYEMYSTDHLSPEEEAEVSALFARHALLQQQLEMTSNTTAGKKVALQVQAARKKILAKLTSIPEEQCGKLPLAAQGKLLAAITAELEGPDEDDEPAAAEGDEE